ncbi:MAG: mandelate racemase/muconate lactonizing enzyme family protein [Alphaproteobacteria bacterium]|nr:mandelate racemase/muconate lactonizing enzyme family protein [Alphaproteobacteria bacterium]
MTITKLEVWNFRPLMRDGPYAMSHVTQDSAYGRILKVHTGDGRHGLGEVVFPPSVPQHVQMGQIAEERAFLALLIGQPVDTLLDLATDLRDRGKTWGGIGFGVETAWYDLVARQKGCPVSDLLGGAQYDAVHDYFSISERSPERIRERVALAGPERAVFQLKLGVGTLDDDVEQVTSLLAAMSPGQTVLADANGGWSVERACETMARFDDARIVWEEPCSLYEDNVEVMRRSGIPVMVDQSVSSAEVALKAASDGHAHSICIKPAFLGGLSVAQTVRDAAAAAGMKMRIDGPWCGDIATAANLHLAVGAPPELLISSCDLREPLVLTPSLGGIRNLPDTRMALNGGPGLGVCLPEDALGAPEATYG